MYDFSRWTDKQLVKGLKYERQFAGAKDVTYHRDLCKAIIKEIKARSN